MLTINTVQAGNDKQYALGHSHAGPGLPPEYGTAVTDLSDEQLTSVNGGGDLPGCGTNPGGHLVQVRVVVVSCG